MDRRRFLRTLAAPAAFGLARGAEQRTHTPVPFTTFHRPAPGRITVLAFAPPECEVELQWLTATGPVRTRPEQTRALEAFEGDRAWLKHVFPQWTPTEPPAGYRLIVAGEPYGPERIPAPAPGEPVRAAVFGDSGHAGPAQAALLRNMRSEDCALVLHTGDLAYPLATLDCLRRNYLEPYAEWMSTVPFYPCLGNHDFGPEGRAHALELHELPSSDQFPPGCYTFSTGGARFISINSNEPLQGPGPAPVPDWLENALASAPEFFRVVFLHHTPYPNLRHSADYQSLAVRERLIPVLARHRVPLLLAGHEHLYQRTTTSLDSRQPVVVTTGGGGGGIYEYAPIAPNEFGLSAYHYVTLEFRGYTLHVRAKDVEGTVFDDFVLRPAPEASLLEFLSDGTFRIRGLHLAQSGDAAGVEVHANGAPLRILRAEPDLLEAETCRDLGSEALVSIRNPNGVWSAVMPVVRASTPDDECPPSGPYLNPKGASPCHR